MSKRITLFIITTLLIFSYVSVPLPVTGLNEAKATRSIQSAPFSILSDTPGSSKQDRLLSVQLPGSISYALISQPQGNPSYVSSQMKTLTRFRLADRYGTIGLLAHNTHAGAAFNDLHNGGLIGLQYEDQKSVTYRIQSFRKFQAQTPNSPYSTFIDLEDGTRYSASELFMNIYGVGNELVLQTCLTKNGLKNWGRLFVIAEEISQQPQLDYLTSAQNPGQIFTPVTIQ